MDIQGPKRNNRARERHMARHRKHKERLAMRDEHQRSRPPVTRNDNKASALQLILQEIQWYVRRHSWVWRSALALAFIIPIVVTLSLSFSGRIYPNVRVMGVNLGRMTSEEAASVLRDAWLNDISLDVVAEGTVIDSVKPQNIGLQFDAAATIDLAQQVGLREGLFGTEVSPVVMLTDTGYLVLQEYLLNMTNQINTAPYNAGFRWVGDTLVGEPGRTGRLLDIAPTLATVRDNPATVVAFRQMTIFISPVPPEVSDPTPYISQVAAYAAQPFTMQGYDPFTDQITSWSTDRDTFTSWLEVDSSGLSLREDAFAPFINAQTNSLNTDVDYEARYLNVEETMSDIRNAIARQQSDVMLRVRYRPENYVVEAGDTASKIARKSGIPYYMIQEQNAGRDMNVLSIGDRLNMPTRDVTMPHKPVHNKRIIVDLDRQEMWAFENGELIFNWNISSGRSEAPTAPGIYQILTHNEVAFGSSFTLCDDIGCGQWEMSWFMGVYEVVPGLMNGFHGSVLLPNGAYLNGGATGYPSTFGCVMAYDPDAEALYRWAEQGTIVEIISGEFRPLSELAISVTQQA